MSVATAIPLSDITYVLPLKQSDPEPDDDLADYLAELSALVPVVVADGSPPEVFTTHSRQWGRFVRQIPVTSRALNGKVAGVCDGVVAADSPYVIIADDDVRFDASSLHAVAQRLADHDVVVPQNVFEPLPWHARWDTARMLLNRAFGVEYAGTTALKRELFVATRGYCGGVLFENLELLRTLAAHGSEPHYALDIFVIRRPPSADHFLDQRRRQAYDSLAQPARLCLELCLLPMMAVSTRRRGLGAGLAAGVTLLAELGRRRARGSRAFPPSSSLWSPLWTLERAICSWLAVLSMVGGGVHYSGRRLRRAAHPTASLSGTDCPEPNCECRLQLRREGR